MAPYWRSSTRDEAKRKLCEKRGIHLIEVPEIGTLQKVDELKSFIKKSCIEKEMPLSEDYDRIDVQLNRAYFTHFLKELNEIALHRDGKCLSKMYKGNDESLEWECSKGHRWEATPHNIKKGTWCPVCAGITKLSIGEMQQIAEERGGCCLSTTYQNAWTKLLWECSKGHRWKAAPAMIKGGTWCPKCRVEARAGKQRHTIEYMQKIAKERGGRCLSSSHISTTSKISMECAEGHKWKATPHHIKGGTWCPICSGNVKLSIEEMQQIAKERSGSCLSDTYKNVKTKLLWECAKGHRWESAATNIISGTWCPKCAKETGSLKQRSNIDEMRNIAIKRGGRCLSKTYVNSHTKLLWECTHEHRWKALPTNVKRGSWCPVCAVEERSKNRKYSIEDMQEIAGKRGGKCLSAEYQGSFTKLMWECSEGHKWDAAPGPIIFGTWCPKCAKERSASKQRSTIDEMTKIAKSRGGLCISDIYVNSDSKLLWKCSEGHTWEAIPKKVKKGSWCPYCAGTAKLSISDMQEIAIKRGGRCLSKTYVNSHTKLLWECTHEHRWKALPTNVKRGSWCPVCAKER